MALEVIALPVQESRAQRLQRQQARFRDRGGIFVPSNRNTLADILLGRAPPGQSPRKSRARSTSRSPRKEKRRKSTTKDLHDVRIEQDPVNHKTVRSSPRKCSVRKEPPEELVEQQPVAGPSQISKTQRKRRSKPAASHDTEALVDALAKGKSSAKVASKARTKSSKKATLLEVVEDQATHEEPPAKKSKSAPKKPGKAQPATKAKRKPPTKTTSTATPPNVEVERELSNDRKSEGKKKESACEESTGKEERPTKPKSQKAADIQTRPPPPERVDAPKKSGRPGRARSKKVEGAYDELSPEEATVDITAEKNPERGRSTDRKKNKDAKDGAKDGKNHGKATKATSILSKKRTRSSDGSDGEYHDGDDTHRRAAPRKRSKAVMESNTNAVPDQSDTLAHPKKAPLEPVLTSKPLEKSQKKRERGITHDAGVLKVAKQDTTEATESPSRKHSREEKVPEEEIISRKHKKAKQVECQSKVREDPVVDVGERKKTASQTSDRSKKAKKEKQKENSAAVLLNVPKKTSEAKGSKGPPARVLNIIRKPRPQVDDNEPDPIDFLS